MDLDAVRRTYAAWAPHYDSTHAWTLPYRRRARLALEVRPGDRVLDLACGTGLNLPHLRDLVGDEGSITGVDLSPAMLTIARERIARNWWGNVELREADAAELPFEDRLFDRVICTFALSIIPDCRRAVAEVCRVMAPSGRFVALEVDLKASQASGWPSTLLKGWIDRAGRTCALDLERDTLSMVRSAFTDLEVHRYLLGLFYLGVGTNPRIETG